MCQPVLLFGPPHFQVWTSDHYTLDLTNERPFSFFFDPYLSDHVCFHCYKLTWAVQKLVSSLFSQHYVYIYNLLGL